ncbi:MAG: NAD(+) kinase [Candidatus Dormibacteraceae bacterium]
MRACIVHHPRVDLSRAEAALTAAGFESWRQERESPGAPNQLADTQLVLTLGGDGTFLHGARLALPHGIPVLGVNLGRLGMLTELEPAGLEAGLARFRAGDYRVEERTGLDVQMLRGGLEIESGLALNEVMVHRGASLKLIRFAMSVAGQEIGTIDADGVLVATATGSTAYALALGGPILEPELEDIVLVPMNPFALTVRPIVLRPRVEVVIELAANPGAVTSDGYLSWAAQPGDQVRVRTHRERLRVVRFGGPEEFYRLLRQKIGWGTPLVPRPHTEG